MTDTLERTYPSAEMHRVDIGSGFVCVPTKVDGRRGYTLKATVQLQKEDIASAKLDKRLDSSRLLAQFDPKKTKQVEASSVSEGL